MDSPRLSCLLGGAFVLRGREAARRELLSMYGCVKRRHGTIYGHSPDQLETSGRREVAHNVLRGEKRFTYGRNSFVGQTFFLCTDTANLDGGKLNVIRIFGNLYHWHSDPCWPIVGPDHNLGKRQLFPTGSGLLPTRPDRSVI